MASVDLRGSPKVCFSQRARWLGSPVVERGCDCAGGRCEWEMVPPAVERVVVAERVEGGVQRLEREAHRAAHVAGALEQVRSALVAAVGLRGLQRRDPTEVRQR